MLPHMEVVIAESMSLRRAAKEKRMKRANRRRVTCGLPAGLLSDDNWNLDPWEPGA